MGKIMALASGFRVNTNTTSFHTYRSYSSSQAGLEQNIERLSSGLRINRAADDSAGQAISQRMKNQATGMRQAVRNSQQATNYLQTAEGGLNQIHGILSRMRELAVQSSSDGLNTNDRFSIELEYAQLKDEVSRIANSTTYNDMTLINGDRAKDVSRTGGNISDTEIKSFSVASNVATGDAFEFTSVSANSITLTNKTTGEEQILHQPDGAGYDSITDAADGFSVTQGDFVTMQVGADNDAAHARADSSDADHSAVTENRITLNISDATAKGLGISDSQVSDLADSQRAINALDSAIEKVNDERGNIGALQNRFEFAVSNLQSSLQNTEASRSTILDADFALEAAGMAKNQILTQSGTAMLAQANQISQNVLSLLK